MATYYKCEASGFEHAQAPKTEITCIRRCTGRHGVGTGSDGSPEAVM